MENGELRMISKPANPGTLSFSIFHLPVTVQSSPINRDLFEWRVGSGEWGVVVEILQISNKIKSRRDLLRHSQLPTPNSKLLDKFQFTQQTKKKTGGTPP